MIRRAFSGSGFAERLMALAAAIEAQDGARLPGARRAANREANIAAGVEVDDKLIERIKGLPEG